MNQIGDIQEIRRNVLDWLETLRVRNKKCGIYRMSRSTEATLFSSCFAIFLRKLYNNLDDASSSELEEYIEFIQGCQDKETGLFIDPHLKHQSKFEKELGKSHGLGYTTWQSTTFCLSALDALSIEKRYPLRFLDSWKDSERIQSWLSGLDWEKNTWCNGNLAMFLGIALIHEMQSTNLCEIREYVDTYFKWHDKNQDPQTGFWGTNLGTSIDQGLFGAMHQYLLYYYTNKKLNYMDKIVDNTLLLQQRDGLFSAQGGGDGCMDLDAIDTLVNMYMLNEYKRPLIEQAMKKAFVSTLDLQCKDGGFLWTKRYRFGIRNWFNLGTSVYRHHNLKYWRNSCKDAVIGQFVCYNKPRLSLGWTSNPIPTNESDLFSTWFRSLNLALISQVLSPKCSYREYNWGFLESPGLGYFRIRP